MHEEPGRLGIRHERRGTGGRAVGVVRDPVAIHVVGHAVAVEVATRRADDVALPRTEAVSVGGNLGQAGRGDQVCVGAGVAGSHEVVRAVAGRVDRAIEAHVVGVDELHQPHPRHAAQLFQIGHFERLDEHRGVRPVPPVSSEHVEHPTLEGQACPLVIGRMLGFGIHAHDAPVLALCRLRQRDDFGEGRHLVDAVVLLGTEAEPLHRPQGLDLSEREVVGEPARAGTAVNGLGGAARRELWMRGHVGRARDVHFVTSDEHAVLGGDEVWLDVVRALFDGQRVRGERVLGQIAGGAAVAEHERRGLAADVAAIISSGEGGGDGNECRRGEQCGSHHQELLGTAALQHEAARQADARRRV